MTTSSDISDRILEAVLAKKLLPGSRLGEQQLANLFNCSRTIVREALTRLAVRRIVTVSVGRGWYLAQPSEEDARDTFEARRVIETGLLGLRQTVDKVAIRRLQDHMSRQQAAIHGGDPGLRSFLLGDFHVCLAECLGNKLLAETLRDFTVRTTLIAVHHQSERDAAKSCAEHGQIVEAVAARDLALAGKLMAGHLGTWHTKLPLQADGDADPLTKLRDALRPLDHGKNSLASSKGRTPRPSLSPQSGEV